ncbi:MAG: SDR family oxidoreductase [Syntrophomonadaceae bacterium]|nr:SDR family oxidoreductase [Syntrophomonadaceae bacterium]
MDFQLKDFGLDITGKVALVTGGGTGIGRAIALTLAKAGADVLIISLPHNAKEVEQTVQEIKDMGRRAVGMTDDLTNRPVVDAMIEKCVKELGVPDIAVLNHGFNKQYQTVDIPDEFWNKVYDTFVNSYFHCVKALGKLWIGRETPDRIKGRLIIVSSNTGLRGGGGRYLHYSTAKAANIQMARNLAVEWAKYDITANVICPGIFKTQLSSWANDPMEKQLEHVARIPLHWARQEPITMEDNKELIGTIALYLSSPAADYTTGGVFVVDAGMSERF